MFRSLEARFIIFLVLILTLAIGISSYVHLKIQYNQFMDITREKLKGIADTVEKSIRTSMEEGKSKDVKKIIKAVGGIPEIEKIRIFSKRGMILVSSIPEEVGTMIDKHDMDMFHQRKFSTVYDIKNLSQPIFSIIKPVLNEPVCFPCHGSNLNDVNGILDVEVSMRDIHDRISTVRRFMITSALITLLALVLSILFLLSRLVNRPIQDLIKTMRKAERGDLTARVVPDDTLELEELGRNFNAMISRLEKAQQDLKDLHEQQMERVDRFATIGELAAGIAHEIKNPIAGIGGAIQIMLQDLTQDDPRREIFDEILNQIDRIDRDVKDLLSYARTTEPEFADRDINRVINQSIFLLQDRAAQQNVDVVTHCDEKIPKVNVDEKQIQQVLVNLGLNAIQAMPQGGVLMYTSKMRKTDNNKELVEIQVKDTGKGIPSEHMSKIFVPFFTTHHTGTGLGLPISKKIVQQHKGRIEVKTTQDKGTCFTILLPLNRDGSRG
ncbi:MAG: ATP-binding protein [bacterium]